jgi:hypothetical protein
MGGQEHTQGNMVPKEGNVGTWAVRLMKLELNLCFNRKGV